MNADRLTPAEIDAAAMRLIAIAESRNNGPTKEIRRSASELADQIRYIESHGAGAFTVAGLKGLHRRILAACEDLDAKGSR